MPTISPVELKVALEDSNVTLIDVREEVEYNQEHIAGSIHIPFNLLNEYSLPNDNSNVVFHCQGGTRSAKACKLFLSTHPNRVIKNLKGGLTAWKHAGLPVKRHHQVLSLHRQLFIIIGSMLTFFSIMVIKGYHSFISIILLLGLGMIFAGATGLCLMAQALRKLPWNKHL
ncbi:rhodanese-like domain-containing protein [Candidatus Clavichlamydia salmonicola]|uniref:rhodanese-like domain-containing protein n=1 Tax=Candidatus Clavichlamydia salmonicola TaxID=469812 RepID=UPI001891F25F|nr:rhodanese-like domain-containing protein [Candidatus Clavichlamydia salmonicola]